MCNLLEGTSTDCYIYTEITLFARMVCFCNNISIPFAFSGLHLGGQGTYPLDKLLSLLKF